MNNESVTEVAMDPQAQASERRARNRPRRGAGVVRDWEIGGGLVARLRWHGSNVDVLVGEIAGERIAPMPISMAALQVEALIAALHEAYDLQAGANPQAVSKTALRIDRHVLAHAAALPGHHLGEYRRAATLRGSEVKTDYERGVSDTRDALHDRAEAEIEAVRAIAHETAARAYATGFDNGVARGRALEAEETDRVIAAWLARRA